MLPKISLSSLSFIFLSPILLISQQQDRWQQWVSYQMDIELDVETHQMEGTQQLLYANHSPDTLHRVFYHLYYNAFQPGSMMDLRLQNIPDPDPRAKGKIPLLKENEMGWHRIQHLLQDGDSTRFEVAGTILEVDLAHPLLPGDTCLLDMQFSSQVPVMIRRTGRNNQEGIAYTMSQWYPKMCEYDLEGWHANPYIGGEFYGVWGDFDVKITIDADYTLGGTGYLQNPAEVGHGYSAPGVKPMKPVDGKYTWHFVAERVHDFAWAADPDYVHEKVQVPGGPELHFIYQADTLTKNWKNLQAKTVQCFQMAMERFGPYPFEQFTIIQGGDGGMEYPMATIITGHRGFRSLVSVTVHEVLHAWYYMLLGTNESRYAWMDEGFTIYAQDLIMDSLFQDNKLNPHLRAYNSYYYLVEANANEPASLPADFYQTGFGYTVSSYYKGAMLLHQLTSIVGQECLDRCLKKYYDQWAYKHPEPRDFKRIVEKDAQIELDWFFDHWIHSTNVIDYGIDRVNKRGKKTEVNLHRFGTLPMPVDLTVTYKDGEVRHFHIPLRMMRGAKNEDNWLGAFTLMEDWPWTHPDYTFELDCPLRKIEKIEIDANLRIADINRKNNIYPQEPEKNPFNKN